MGLYLFMSLLYRLLFPMITISHFLEWIIFCTDDSNKKQKPRKASSVFAIPDFQMSNQIVLTQVFLMNHWFVAILEGLYGMTYSDLCMYLFCKSYSSFMILLLTIKSFFRTRVNKPPDASVFDNDC